MDSRTRILACAYTCSPIAGGERFGGGESILGWNIIRQLARFNQLWVIADSSNRPAVEEFLKSEPMTSTVFNYLELPRWLRPVRQVQGGVQLYSFLWQIWAYFEARRLHKRFNFQVFHHVTYANDWMASYIGALLPVPYVRGPGGGAHRTPKSFLGQYNFKGRMWERIRSAGQWMFRHDPFFVMGQNRAKALFVCNKEAFEAVSQKWGSKAAIMAVCGVSESDLCLPNSAARQDSTFRVIAAGKLLRIKGFGLAIRAFAIFAKNHPESELTIVGDGPEYPHLNELVRQHGVQDKVKFEGWMDRQELLRQMATSDVFLFPGLRDGGGAVVVEAMAMGTPVICLDIGGPALHVSDGNGIKIAASSPEQSVREMAAALGRLCDDPRLLDELGRAARERAEEVYHWDRVGERIQQVYANITDHQPLS